jgi:hypothetical protein
MHKRELKIEGNILNARIHLPTHSLRLFGVQEAYRKFRTALGSRALKEAHLKSKHWCFEHCLQGAIVASNQQAAKHSAVVYFTIT